MNDEKGFIEVDGETAYKIVMSMYLGEKCKYCLREFKTLEDLNDTVWAGCHEHGRLACRSCWKKNNIWSAFLKWAKG